MESKFSKYLTAFGKNYNTQNPLLRKTKSWKAKLNNGSKFEVIIMDLLKAFDSLNHDLSFAKLEAYGLDNNAVSFIRSCLTNRLQHCKTNNSFSKWAKTSARVLKGSLLGPLIFNIFIKNIFLLYFFKNLTWKIMPMIVLCIPQINMFLQS